jgi:hypothetical protein
MTKPKNIKQVIEMLELEKTLLIACATDLGFFYRLATKSIPMLLSHPIIGAYIREWDAEINDTQTVCRAAEEVRATLKRMWRRSIKSRDRELRVNVWKIVRMIRGPAMYKNLIGSLVEQIYHPLKNLFQTCFKHENFDKSHPNLSQLYEKDDVEKFRIESDAEPKQLWLKLSMVRTCWPLRNGRALPFYWAIPRGTAEEIGTAAVDQHRRFMLQAIAENFKDLNSRNKPNHSLNRSSKPIYYFARERFNKVVTRLFDEIVVLITLESYPKKRTDRHAQDREKIQSFMKEQKKIDPNCSKSKMVGKVRMAIRRGELILQYEYQESTLESYFKQIDKATPLEEKLKRPKAKNRPKSKIG